MTDEWDLLEHDTHLAEQRSDALYRHGDVTPDPKPQKRQKGGRKQWAILRHNLNRECVVCGEPSQSAHHLMRRSQSGDDVAANLVGLCGHGTAGCHGLVERRVRHALVAVRRALTPDQLAYLLERRGEAWIDRHYPVANCEACGDVGCTACEVAA